MTITSLENDKVKKFRKLQKRKYREEYNEYIIEGHHLILEAFKRGAILELIVLEGKDTPVPAPYNYYSYEVMKKISAMDNPPEVMALCKMLDTDNDIKGDKILVLDEIQDPGNLGTIIRSSVAFNFDTVVISKNTVDLYNPKVIRSTKGMLFNVNIIVRELYEFINGLDNYMVYGTDVVDGDNIRDIDMPKNVAVVIGNEGRGISSNVRKLCDKFIYIDMNNMCESLNASVAASILMYEVNNK